MLMQRFIHHAGVEFPAVTETAAEARERLRDKFPRGALRRMTHLGLLTGAALDGVTWGADDAVIYASTFAETRALEEYLASFPTPSPLLFQTSIHPGAVQQVFIGRQQPLGRLWPLAGRARLVEQAGLTALLEPAARVVLVGGEERGTWMLEQQMAQDRAFAFALGLGRDETAAIGRLSFARQAPEPADERCPPLVEFAEAIAERRALRWRGAGGAWSLEWR